jgi:hypothetical protein
VKQLNHFLVAYRLEVLVKLAHGVKEARRQQANGIIAPVPDLAKPVGRGHRDGHD